MPTTHLGWYTDMYIGYKYWTFISQELPEICRGFFPDDLSCPAGGHLRRGAVRWAATGR